MRISGSLLASLLVSAALLTNVACNSGAEGGAAAARQQKAVPVSVAEVFQRDMPVEINAIGAVEALSTVQVISQVTGMVMDVHFKEGDFVKRGDLLFTIDTRPYSSTLAAAQAELAKNRALAQQAAEDAERFAKLQREGITSQQELDRARANAASLAATLQSDLAQIQSARLNVQFAKIRSPIDGRTGSVLVYAGNVVRANDTQPLVVIRSISPTYVRFAVPQDNLPRVRARLAQGTLPLHATSRGEGGKTAHGELTFLENTVDPATGTIALKGLFKNEQLELWPGEFVDVVLELALEKNAIVAPEAAVQEGQEGAYAFVVNGGNKASLRSIKVKRTTASYAVIETGLKPGEKVVTDGQIRLRDGSPVTLKPALRALSEPNSAVKSQNGKSPQTRQGPVQ